MKWANHRHKGVQNVQFDDNVMTHTEDIEENRDD